MATSVGPPNYFMRVSLVVCVCFFWAPIEIALKAQSLRVLNAAYGGDGAAYTIGVLFDLELAGFAILALSATCFIGNLGSIVQVEESLKPLLQSITALLNLYLLVEQQ
ncbi:hypothetical protein F5883DRAFT_717935 [Diaporthe sp. PMI_573]|nr:hypothetical protein F5883DRAFT_717935 [Diaporthaceae sp. PMI_573]